jgi:hypothetical protein
VKTRPITPEVAGFVGELLRREGDPRRSRAVQAVHAWLAEGRRASASGDEALAGTAPAAANAVRLLLGLSRWAGEREGWIPAGADLRRVRMVGEDLRGAALPQADLRDAELSGVDLSEADLGGADLSRARLVGAVLDRAVLADARACGADLTLVAADRCRLERADLSDARLRQSCWTDPLWDRTTADGADVTLWAVAGCRSLPDSSPRLAPLPPGTETTIITGHQGRVWSVAWEPGGARLASGGEDGTVRQYGPSGQWLCTFEAVGDSSLVRTAGGFCLFGGGLDRVRLRVRRPEQPGTVLYVPLGGLRAVIERPDKVQAVLTGDRSGDDLAAELARRGWGGGVSWDGKAWFVPRVITAVGQAVSTSYATAVSVESLGPNQFRPGPPLIEVADLPGREPVIAELLALIEGRSPAILRGPRRSGKTSIFHALARRLGADRHVRHVTLERSRIRTADDLARCLEPDLRDDPTPAETLHRRLRAEDRPVLLIDEVAYLRRARSSKVFAWLRAVGQGDASLVLAGSHWDWLRVVAHAAKVPGSSFGNDVTPVDLGPLDEADAVAFLVATAPGDVPLEAERTARWIVELCGPWPFYLQVMGHAVVQSVRAGKRLALVDRQGVFDLYLDRLLQARDPVFRGRWGELPPEVRAVLLGMGDAPPSYDRLPRAVQQRVFATGLCSPDGIWVEDRPFDDWIRRNASSLRGAT